MTILCLTGTNPYPFLRLVSYVDQVLGSKYNVTIQLGSTIYDPKYSKFFDYCERSKIFELIENADIVITQGGYGSMTDVLSCSKPLIAVPRLIELGESQDNQKELVDYFAKKRILLACYDVEELERLLTRLNSNQYKLNTYAPESSIKISNMIENYLKSINL